MLGHGDLSVEMCADIRQASSCSRYVSACAETSSTDAGLFSPVLTVAVSCSLSLLALLRQTLSRRLCCDQDLPPVGHAFRQKVPPAVYYQT